MRRLFLIPVILCGGLHLAACDDGKSKKKKDKDDDEKTEESRKDDEGGDDPSRTDADEEGRGDELITDDEDSESRGRRSSGSFNIEGERCHDGLDITQIEVSEHETTVSFEMDPSIESYYIQAPGETFAFQITDRDARVEGVYHLTDVRDVQASREGHPVMLDASKGDGSFRLVFEPLPRSVSQIYLTEGSDWDNRRDPENTWRCDDVSLR